jgi:hypothetical protein
VPLQTRQAPRVLWALAAAGLVTPVASPGPVSFTITTLVMEGDSVPGVGLVTRIDNLAVNDQGDWLVVVGTDFKNPEADTVLLRNGNTDWREADAVPAPSGAVLGSFDSITINNAGRCGYNFFLFGTPDGFNDDSGVYWFSDPGASPFDGTVLVVQESETAPGLTAATPFTGFLDVKINNADQLLVVASVDDSNIESPTDRALYILESDPDSGGISSFELINVEGDLLPGQTETIADFGKGPHLSALNDSGHVLFYADLNGNPAIDGTIYSYDGLDRLLLAQEGSPSPIPARTWSSLSDPEMDLNNTGDFVFSGVLSGETSSDLLIVRNNLKFRQEGDPVPGISTGVFLLTDFGAGPVEISDAGQVVWYGDWDDPNTDVDSGLFLDDELLVQEGVTTIDGIIVDRLRGIENGYRMSGNGQFIIFEAILLDGRQGAFLIEIQGPCPWDCQTTPDGEVGIADFLALLAQWGTPGSCDFDGDGAGVTDFLDILAWWGPCPR